MADQSSAIERHRTGLLVWSCFDTGEHKGHTYVADGRRIKGPVWCPGVTAKRGVDTVMVEFDEVVLDGG